MKQMNNEMCFDVLHTCTHLIPHMHKHEFQTFFSHKTIERRRHEAAYTNLLAKLLGMFFIEPLPLLDCLVCSLRHIAALQCQLLEVPNQLQRSLLVIPTRRGMSRRRVSHSCRRWLADFNLFNYLYIFSTAAIFSPSHEPKDSVPIYAGAVEEGTTMPSRALLCVCSTVRPQRRQRDTSSGKKIKYFKWYSSECTRAFFPQSQLVFAPRVKGIVMIRGLEGDGKPYFFKGKISRNRKFWHKRKVPVWKFRLDHKRTFPSLRPFLSVTDTVTGGLNF